MTVRTRRSGAVRSFEGEDTPSQEEEETIDMSEEEEEEEEKERHYHYEILESLSLWQLLRFEPWEIIPEGSLLGHFDWIPEQYRVGKWSSFAPVVLGSFLYLWLMGGVYLFVTNGWDSASDVVRITDYPELGSLLWYYHLGGFLWMCFIAGSVLFGPAGIRAWVTYTMWSWTILTLRHGLCALAPWLSSAWILEATRLPALLMTTIVFVLWNFVVGPFIFFFGMTTPEKRHNFIKYFTNFRLTQLHVNIIILSIMNNVVASPIRALQLVDLYFTVSVSLLYMVVYLFFLDRIGVHIYPLFTPRSDWCIVTYSSVLLIHLLGYKLYSPILSQGDMRQAILLWLGQ